MQFFVAENTRSKLITTESLAAKEMCVHACFDFDVADRRVRAVNLSQVADPHFFRRRIVAAKRFHLLVEAVLNGSLLVSRVCES